MINFVHNRPARLTAAYDVLVDEALDSIIVDFAVAAGSPEDIWVRKRGVEMAGKRLKRGKQTFRVKLSPLSIDLSLLTKKNVKTGELFQQKKSHWVSDQFVFWIKSLKKRRISNNLDKQFASFLENNGVTVLYPVQSILEQDIFDFSLENISPSLS